MFGSFFIMKSLKFFMTFVIENLKIYQIFCNEITKVLHDFCYIKIENFKNKLVMTQEDKDLLLKDLCARLPYGVKAYVKNWSKLDQKYYENIYDIKSIFPSLNEIHVQSKSGSVDVTLGYYDYDIKPYLFPLSSMTEEQEREYSRLHTLIFSCFEDDLCKALTELQDFYNKYHLDYRGLIPADLAIDCTNLNIY